MKKRFVRSGQIIKSASIILIITIAAAAGIFILRERMNDNIQMAETGVIQAKEKMKNPFEINDKILSEKDNGKTEPVNEEESEKEIQTQKENKELPEQLDDTHLEEAAKDRISKEQIVEEKIEDNKLIVVIDPGHQAKGDSTKEPNGPNSSTMKARVAGGTSGRYTGVMEYELTLDISLALRDELVTRGYTVYMTRETHDVNISNMERAQYASSVGADIAVRIHANGVDDSSVSGALALAPSLTNPYIANLAPDSQRLSQCILDAYCNATGMNNQGVVSSDTMTGINWSSVPVTILEMGYMTNPEDDANMEDEEYQKKMVRGIADGVDSYFMVNN